MSENSSDGFFSVLVLLAVIGGVALFWEDIFLTKVTGFSVAWDRGVFWHDLLLTNKTGQDLYDVDLGITLFPERGDEKYRRLRLGRWRNGETTRISVSATEYAKVEVKGTAVVGEENKLVRIRAAWVFHRK